MLSIIFNELIEEYNIKINIFSGNADDILDKIDRGIFDFGLVIDPVNKTKYEHIKLPNPDIWGLLVNDRHHLSKQSSISPNDLYNETLVISNQSLIDSQLIDWLGQKIENFNIVGTYNLLYNVSLLAKASQTCVICLDGIINTSNSNLKFIPFEPKMSSNTSIIWKKNPTFPNSAKLFLKKLRKKL